MTTCKKIANHTFDTVWLDFFQADIFDTSEHAHHKPKSVRHKKSIPYSLQVPLTSHSLE